MKQPFLAVLLMSTLCGCQARESSRAPPQPTGTPPSNESPPSTESPPQVELALSDPEPGSCFDRQLLTDEIHDVRLELAAEEALHLTLEQRGVDVKAQLSGPSLAPVIFDSPTDTTGTEQIFFVTRKAGEHRIEIRAWDAKTRGPYRLCIESRRPATDRDRMWANAVRAFYLARYGEGIDPDQRVVHYKEAADLAARVGEAAFQARVLTRLGELEMKRHRLDPAIASLQQALELWQRSGDLEQEALVHDQLGSAWRRQGESELRRGAHEQALDIWRRLGRPAAEASALNNLGLVAKQAGRYRLALERYNQALALWQRIGERCDLAKTHANLGNFYTLFNEHSRAWDHYRQALAVVEQCEKAGVVAQTLPAVLTKMGDLLAAQGKSEEALVQYREALSLRRHAGDRYGEAVTLNSIALVPGSENARAAFAAYRSALAIFRELGNVVNQALVLRNLAVLQESVGDLRQARRSNEAALDLARQIQHHEVQALAQLGLAQVARQAGDLPEAERHARQAVEQVDTRHGAIARSDLRSSYLTSRQTPHDLLITILAQRHRSAPGRGFDDRAFEVSDGSRARELLDRVTQGHRPPPSPALEALIAEINSTHREWLRASQSQAATSLGAIEADLRSLLARHHELSTRERPDSEHSAAVSLGRIRDQILDRDSLLLAYHFTAESGWLWAVTPSASTLHEIAASRAQIEAAVAALLASELRSTEEPAAHLQAIGHQLLAPVARQLDRSRLLITGPGVLQALPWAALPDPATGQPLSLEHEIVHLPSLAVLEALRARSVHRAATTPRIAIVANAVYGPDDPRLTRPLPAGRLELPWLAPLPASLAEAKAAARLGAPSHEYLGFEARRELLSRGELAGVRILHLATHALLDLPGSTAQGIGRAADDFLPLIEPADLASLVFSRFDRDGRPIDGYLRSYEIRRLELGADLVVLSACRTVLGEDVRGEGLVGLTHAFLAAGARQVVATLWDVDDRATAELMGFFYRGLSRGLPASRALSQAQAAMWQQEAWRAPHFWAGFVLQGDWMPPRLKPPV